MKIRSVQSKDFDEWLRMRSNLWPDCPREEHLVEMQEYLVESTKKTVFVADRFNERLGGFIEIDIRPFDYYHDTLVGYIEGWYVDSDLRGEGVGKKLVIAAENWTIENGCNEMGSDAEVSNLISIKAHKALGYQVEESIVKFRKKLNR